MGDLSPTQSCMPIMAAFSRYPEALDWARQRACAQLGPLLLESPAFDFSETAYYQPTMGPDLKKCFWAFAGRFDAGDLAKLKLATNEWESEYAALGLHDEPRPLNLDPGYITMAKLVLASTKDHAHRIYLGLGIYAEITLMYRHKTWEAHEWTFPDYRRADYHAFFTHCRNSLKGSADPSRQQR